MECNKLSFHQTNDKINKTLWSNSFRDCKIGQEIQEKSWSFNTPSLSEIHFGGEFVFRNSYYWTKVTDILSPKYSCREVTLFYPVHPVKGNNCNYQCIILTLLCFLQEMQELQFFIQISLLPQKDPYCFFLSLQVLPFFTPLLVLLKFQTRTHISRMWWHVIWQIDTNVAQATATSTHSSQHQVRRFPWHCLLPKLPTSSLS